MDTQQLDELMLDELTAVSPIDGRYRNKTKGLSRFFSEQALIGYRAHMEIKYLLALDTLNKDTGKLPFPHLTPLEVSSLEALMKEVLFNKNFAQRVKKAEKETNHDVKAVEYVLREILTKQNFNSHFVGYCHFGLTSEDVTNVAHAHSMHDFVEFSVEILTDLTNSIWNLAHKHAKDPMLSHTHGQRATPTTFGKEMIIAVQRLNRELKRLREYKPYVKLNGASGNYNGHYVTHPDINWQQFSYEFFATRYTTQHQGPWFEFNEWTNQIEDHDTLSELFASFQRINVILKKFCIDMWLYISMEYILQIKSEKEVGSSAMPHKVNPIDFENAEGNLDLAHGMLDTFIRILPNSRLQRHLSDSTMTRNFGVAFGYSVIAYASIEKGLTRISVNTEKMLEDLNDTPEILAEAYQLILKKNGHENAYEKLKDLTRGKKTELSDLHIFIDQCDIPDADKERLKNLTPADYIGIAPSLAGGLSNVDKDFMVRHL